MYRENIQPRHMKSYRSTKAMENVAVAQYGVNNEGAGLA